jgi:hypothetical protein
VVELAGQADIVVDLTAAGSPPPAVPLVAPRHHRVPEGLGTARTVVVLADDPAAARRLRLPGARVLIWPPAPGVDLLLAAGAAPYPVLQAGPVPETRAARRDLATLAAATPATTVLTGPVDADVLAELRERLPEHTLLLPDPAVGWGVGAVEIAPGGPLDPTRVSGLRRSPALALRPPDREPPLAVDPAALARRLRAAGVTGRDAADVLAGLGVPRRTAYGLATGAGTPPER